MRPKYPEYTSSDSPGIELSMKCDPLTPHVGHCAILPDLLLQIELIGINKRSSQLSALSGQQTSIRVTAARRTSISATRASHSQEKC